MKLHFTKSLTTFAVAAAVILALVFIFNATAFAAQGGADQNGQKFFNTPDDAVNALILAFKNNDTKTLTDILGKQYKGLVETSDKAADNADRQRFLELAAEKKSIKDLPDGCKELVVGNIEWPFPVTLVKEKNGWHFDSETGFEELLNRAIGQNETNVIQICKVYTQAQREYAQTDRMGKGIIEYAQKFKSSTGKKDGLYWPTDSGKGENDSPLGPLISDYRAYFDSGKKSAADPFCGYYFKILTAQGPDAPGGAYSYIIKGHMVSGFALAAFPAKYGSTGIMTFIVNQQGKIYQKDLGKDTANKVKNMQSYNPDKTWSPAE